MLSQNWRLVRRQDGSDGWSVAQERDEMIGCAEAVRGATAEREAGRVSLPGKSVGEI